MKSRCFCGKKFHEGGIMSETGFVMDNKAGKDVEYDKGKKFKWNQ